MEESIWPADEKGCSLKTEDLLVSGPVHSLLLVRPYDLLHIFWKSAEEQFMVNILSIEWLESTVARIHCFWKDTESGKDQGGVFYYFTDSRKGIVFHIDQSLP